MKNLATAILLFVSLGTFAQTDVIDQVFLSLNDRDGASLKDLMQEDVFIEVLDDEDFLSNEEAIEKVNTFLEENSVTSIEYKHRGDSGGGTAYAIGDLKMDGKVLRVYFVVEDGKVSELCFQENN